MRTIFQSDNYSPRETNMEDTEELYYSYLSAQVDNDYEWGSQTLFPIGN